MKKKDRELLFDTNTNKGQQYYDVMDDWHKIKWIRIDGKKINFRVVIDLEEPAKDYKKMVVRVK